MIVPGIYPGMPMADYLAIDALSTTPVRTALDECPRAGWFKSRLNPNRVREVSEIMDIGTIAHGILLEGSTAGVAIIRPEDYPSKTGSVPKGWTNDAIRAARDSAREAGRLPILADDFADVEQMIAVAKDYIGALEHTEPAVWRMFQPTGGTSELTMVWDEDGILCKLRTDRMAYDYTIVCDYKTSGMSVEPSRFARTTLAGMGYYFGAAWYRRGIMALTNSDPSYLFLCQETAAPYLCSLVGIDPAGMALGDEKVAAGLALWRRCLATGQWDGYPNRVCYAELPLWERVQWDERVILTRDGIDYGSQA